MDIKNMQKISIVWGLVLLLIVVGLTAVGFLYKNKSNDYKKLENTLVESTKKYVDAKFLYPEKNQSIKVKYETLKNDNFIGELKKEEDLCDGYVIVKNNGSVYEYEGYVTCPKYETKGYEK